MVSYPEALVASLELPRWLRPPRPRSSRAPRPFSPRAASRVPDRSRSARSLTPTRTTWTSCVCSRARHVGTKRGNLATPCGALRPSPRRSCETSQAEPRWCTTSSSPRSTWGSCSARRRRTRSRWSKRLFPKAPPPRRGASNPGTCSCDARRRCSPPRRATKPAAAKRRANGPLRGA